MRDPAQFAYQWASLDEISGGRTLLAVCNGLQKRERASEIEGQYFGGVPDKQRVARLEEYLDLVRQLWTGEPVTFHGQFAHYDDRVRDLTPRREQMAPGSTPFNAPFVYRNQSLMFNVATSPVGLKASEPDG